VSSPSDSSARARQAVGVSPESRARWLLQFVNSDLNGQDRHQVRVECAVFLGLDLHLHNSGGNPPASRLPPDVEVNQWHRQVKQGLRSLVQGGEWSADATVRVTLRLQGGRLCTRTQLSPQHIVDRFLVKAVETLTGAKGGIKKCSRDDCARLFITKTRQAYCSTTCRGTVNTRRYRQGHP
jgi:hypothetical protein